jgi:CheY-like chemotaxis protein
MNILIVDDDRKTRSVLYEMINASGNHLISVLTNGHSAVNLLADPQHGFDLVFLDLHMPRVNGRRVMEILQDIVQVNFVVITADPSRFGPLPPHVKVLTKPVTCSSILQVLKEEELRLMSRTRVAPPERPTPTGAMPTGVMDGRWTIEEVPTT